jgi:hypothetical protein
VVEGSVGLEGHSGQGGLIPPSEIYLGRAAGVEEGSYGIEARSGVGAPDLAVSGLASFSSPPG